MLKQAVGSLAISLVFAGCGVPPDEEDDWNAMPTQEELLEAAAAAPKQLASFASGDQTRRETGIYTWKIHKNEKNLLTSGYNKNGKRIFRNWIWAVKRSEKGLSTLYMGNAAKLVSFGEDEGHKVHVGARMSAAKKKQFKLVLDGLTRDFKKHGGRFGCATDSVACAGATAACALAPPPVNVASCIVAAAKCADAVESCLVDNFPDDVGEAIDEAIDTMDGVCLTDPLQRFMCQGT